MSLEGYPGSGFSGPQGPAGPTGPAAVVAQPVAVFIPDASLQNGWLNFDATGATWSRVRYYRSADGVVRLSGLIKSGSIAIILSLPASHAPVDIGSGGSMIFLVQAGGTGAAQIVVSANGAVSMNSYVAGGSNAFVSLDGIAFQAAKP